MVVYISSHAFIFIHWTIATLLNLHSNYCLLGMTIFMKNEGLGFNKFGWICLAGVLSVWFFLLNLDIKIWFHKNEVPCDTQYWICWCPCLLISVYHISWFYLYPLKYATLLNLHSYYYLLAYDLSLWILKALDFILVSWIFLARSFSIWFLSLSASLYVIVSALEDQKFNLELSVPSYIS